MSYKRVIMFALVTFVIETVLQVAFFATDILYIAKTSISGDFIKVLVDTTQVVLQVKLICFLLP